MDVIIAECSKILVSRPVSLQPKEVSIYVQTEVDT